MKCYMHKQCSAITTYRKLDGNTDLLKEWLFLARIPNRTDPDDVRNAALSHTVAWKDMRPK